MSASREKQNRQELASSGWTDPKAAREAEQRRKEKRSSILYGIIAAAFVVVAVIAIVWRSNIIPKVATAVTIDGEKYTAAEVSFYYQNAYLGLYNNLSYMASYVGLDFTTSLKSQAITEESSSMLSMMGISGVAAGQTWHDYILNQALMQMAAVQGARQTAEAEGFVYPAGVEAQYRDSIASLEGAATASNLSVDAYLKNTFGGFMTEQVYADHLLRMLQYEAYTSAYSDSLIYPESEITAAYEATPNLYDKVSFESVTISGAADTTDAEGNAIEPTEEDEAAAKEAAKATADAILADYQAGGDLEALAEAQEASYTKNEGISYTADTLMDWLFDSARKAGDTAVLESGANYYVAVFHDRFRDEYATIDVRHILVPLGAATLSAEDEGYEEEQAQLMAAARAEADEILAQWQSGEATEDSFAALAMERSTDGSKYVGGLYTQVYQGQMVESFEDWCFDPTRQAGDTGVVESEFGAHVMYFVGENLPYWQSLVATNLRSEAYTQWETSLHTNSTIERHSFGMTFVG